jgi:hypothetical protein
LAHFDRLGTARAAFHPGGATHRNLCGGLVEQVDADPLVAVRADWLTDVHAKLDGSASATSIFIRTSSSSSVRSST